MYSTTLNRSSVSLFVVACTALLSASCGDSTPTEFTDKCETDVTGATSPVTGALTLTGNFYANESVLLQYLDANGKTQQASGTPATDRTSFTLTGLPSGEKTYTIIISCSEGQENNGSHSYTVK